MKIYLKERCSTLRRQVFSLSKNAVLNELCTLFLALKKVFPEIQLTRDQVCNIGDDIPDLPVLEKVGLSVAVADSSPAIHHSVDWLTQNPGGRGAVREVIDFILQIQGYDLPTLYSCDQSQPIS